MPYRVAKRGSRWAVVDNKGKVYGRHDTKEKALRQVKALYANTRGARKHEYPV